MFADVDMSGFDCDGDMSDFEEKPVVKKTRKIRKTKKVLPMYNDSQYNDDAVSGGYRTGECFNEQFDQHRLYHMIQHKEDYAEAIGLRDDGSDPFIILERYLANSRNGKIDVIYSQIAGRGRLFSRGSLSMSAMSKRVRHTIAKDLYVDIDMVNAHPVILSHLCDIHGIEHDYLTDYIENREARLTELKIDREKAKKSFLTIINGKSDAITWVDGEKTLYLKSFAKEIKTIRKALIAAHKDEFKAHKKYTIEMEKERKDNFDGSFMNILLCDKENEILHKMLEFFDNPKDAVLCFDGVMLPKTVDGYDLTGCEKYLKSELDIDMKLAIKPMDHGFDIKDPEQYQEIDWKKLLHDGDEGMARLFTAVRSVDVKITNIDGDGYVYSHDKALWIKTDAIHIENTVCDTLMPYWEKLNLVTMFMDSGDDEDGNKNVDVDDTEDEDEDPGVVKAKAKAKAKKLKEAAKEAAKRQKEKQKMIKATLASIEKIKQRIQSTKGQRDIFRKAISFLRNSEFANLIDQNHDMLPIPGRKCVMLKTGEVVERTRNHMFSMEIPVSYESDLDVSGMVSELLMPIFVNDVELINDFQLIMGSCLTGNSCRKLFLFHGGGSNGKSTLKDMIARILGDFYGIMSRKVIIDNGSKENSNSHTSHLTPLRGLRVGICDEIRENDKLNVEIMKQLASGESIKIRQLGKEETKLDLILKGIVCLNDIPRFDGGDQAIVDRLCCVPFDCRFVDEPNRSNEVKSSIAFREKLKSGYLAKEFLKWAVVGSIRGYAQGFTFKSAKLIAKTRDIALEEDPLQAFINSCCKMTDSVSVTDFKEAYDAFAVENDLPDALTTITISKKLKRKGFGLDKISGVRSYIGLSLIESVHNDNEGVEDSGLEAY